MVGNYSQRCILKAKNVIIFGISMPYIHITVILYNTHAHAHACTHTQIFKSQNMDVIFACRILELGEFARNFLLMNL